MITFLFKPNLVFWASLLHVLFLFAEKALNNILIDLTKRCLSFSFPGLVIFLSMSQCMDIFHPLLTQSPFLFHTQSQKFSDGLLFLIYVIGGFEKSIFIWGESWIKSTRKRSKMLICKNFSWAAISLIFVMCSCTILVPLEFMDDNLLIKAHANALLDVSNYC